MTVLRVRRLPHAGGLALPRYETEGAAGLDLVAANLDNSPIVLETLARALVPTPGWPCGTGSPC